MSLTCKAKGLYNVSLQGLPGSSGSAGPQGKDGPAVCTFLLLCDSCITSVLSYCPVQCLLGAVSLQVSLNYHRVLLDKMAAPDPLAQLDPEDSPVLLDSPDLRALV